MKKAKHKKKTHQKTKNKNHPPAQKQFYHRFGDLTTQR